MHLLMNYLFLMVKQVMDISEEFHTLLQRKLELIKGITLIFINFSK